MGKIGKALNFRNFVAATGALLCFSGCLTHRAQGDSFDSAGVRIHYTVEGQGEPVVLVHGIAVNGDLNWRHYGVVQALRSRYQVITLDNRGHGLSGKPHDPAAYGPQMSEDVVRLLDRLGVPRAHVIGYSMGAFITLDLVARHPDRLITAIPCAGGWEQPTQADLDRVEGIAASIERGKYGPLLEEIGVSRKGLGRLQIAIMNRAFSVVDDRYAVAAALRSLPALRVSEAQLRANRVPVCSIVGDRDPLKRGVDAMTGVLARHTVVVISGGNHYTTLKKREFLRAIEDFLARHPAAGDPFNA
jgi:pimeloyl-ACP methyl ester carboxylesterase